MAQSRGTTSKKPLREKNSVGLGDLVHTLTKRMGLRECPGCEKRREWLNRLVISRRSSS